MGNLLSRFLSLTRRRRALPGARRPGALPGRRGDAPPGRAHPAASAPALGAGRWLRSRGPAPAASGHPAGRRPGPLPQARRFPLGVLPLVRWEDPPPKPRLRFRNPRTVYIPPPDGRLAPPGQAGRAVRPRPAGAIPPPCPQDKEVKVREEPPEGRAQLPDHQVQREDRGGQASPYSAGDAPLTPRPPETTGVLPPGGSSPGPLALGAQRPQGSWSGGAPPSPGPRSWGGPAGDAPPAPQASPSPGCLLQPQGPAEGVPRADPPPRGPAAPPLCGEMEAPEPPRSSPPPAPAPRKPCKRTLPLPLQLPLPLPLQLQLPQLRWDRGELPPPPKLPCLAGDSILGADTEARAAWGATQSAPASPPPGSAMADPLPWAPHTGQVAAPITAGGDEGSNPQPTSTSDDEDMEMDTTPICYACTITTYPDSSLRFLPVYQIQYSAIPPRAHWP
ncbi:unnamed protein product [Pipistrellus nathusii]|uniref:Basic proline-rich protein-like n=1 Tax=Pipistrellus nathusii TaxID=59473 RepID=A0ABN9Z986_PIPNA